MKTKFFVIAATVVIGGGVAMHAGHEPKCLLGKSFAAKKVKETKADAVATNHVMTDHHRPTH